MRASRRHFLAMGAATAGAALLKDAQLFAEETSAALRPLQLMTDKVVPISREEHLDRIARAQELMGKAGLAALLIEPGASMTYFTGVRWRRSERLTAAVLPRDGEPCIVTPHFEEPSVRESLAVPADVRVWNEDEDPLRTVAGFLRE